MADFANVEKSLRERGFQVKTFATGARSEDLDGPHRGTGRLDPCDQIINRVNCIRAGFHFGSPALFSLSMIHMGREFHLSDDTILEQICKNFDLDQITAREYIDSFGK